MVDLQAAVEDFLAQRVIAVAGVSREGNLPANYIFQKFQAAGYEVYPINPNASEVEGQPCFPDLASVPARIEGVVVGTPPSAAESLVEECIRLGIPRIWMHRSFGVGSVSPDAEKRCKEAGIAVIPGACPMMYLEPVDFGHKCMRWFLKVGRKLPEPSGFSASS